MNARRYNHMMIGLIETAVEKVCVLGSNGAKEDITKIRGMMEDLQCFWNTDEHLSKGDWTEALDKELRKIDKEEPDHENEVQG